MDAPAAEAPRKRRRDKRSREDRNAPLVDAPLLPLRTTVHGELQALTPLHVGNEEQLSPGDVVCDERTCIRIDIPKLLARVAGDEAALRAIGGGRFVVAEFLREIGIPADEVKAYEIAVASPFVPPRFGQPVHTFSRLSNGPIVPGSTIKGALLSGLLWLVRAEARDRDVKAQAAAAAQEGADATAVPGEPPWVPSRFRDLLDACRARPGLSDEAMIEALFGREAEHRITRALTVSDAPARDADLALYHHGIFHLRDPEAGDFTWSGLRGQHVDEQRWMSHAYMEALKPGARVPIEMHFDEFFLREARRKGSALHTPRHAVEGNWCSPQFILSGVGDLSLNALWLELKFYERCRHRRLVDATKALYARCMKLPQNEVLIRLGWGTGWRGQTGLLWDDETARELRLPGRDYNAFPYPKTRRIVFQGDEPLGTPGWALLRVNGQRTGPTS